MLELIIVANGPGGTYHRAQEIPGSSSTVARNAIMNLDH